MQLCRSCNQKTRVVSCQQSEVTTPPKPQDAIAGPTIYGKRIVEAYQAEVVRVIDGDTIVVLKDDKQVKIRLESVDAPEKKQPYAKRSKRGTV